MQCICTACTPCVVLSYNTAEYYHLPHARNKKKYKDIIYNRVDSQKIIYTKISTSHTSYAITHTFLVMHAICVPARFEILALLQAYFATTLNLFFSLRKIANFHFLHFQALSRLQWRFKHIVEVITDQKFRVCMFNLMQCQNFDKGVFLEKIACR